VIEQVFEHVLQ